MPDIHLLIIVHGMWGNPAHVAELARIVEETHATNDGVSLHVHTAQSIRDESTYDGIDWCGERAAKEVLAKVDELETEGQHVVRFSLVGYSMGGLVGRYLIAVLQQRGFFDRIEPMNFMTVATPHAGLVRYQNMFSSIVNTLGPRLLSRTGKQFFCADKWSPGGRPLLVVMADPERLFFQTLAKFKQIRIYANAVNDRTVPYVTSAIETTDPFHDHLTSHIEVVMDEKYPGIIKSFNVSTKVDIAVENKPWYNVKPPRIPLPPFLQFRFPLNLLLYSALPILIPLVFSSMIGYFFLASHKSSARINKLEADALASEQIRLIDVVEEFERQVEESVVDYAENQALELAPSTKSHPIIKDTHRKIAKWLNTLPLKKELAYFPDIQQTHATIVSRDLQRFEFHKRGQPILRHLADSLLV